MTTAKSSPLGVHPGLVLVLAESVARGPADELLQSLRGRLGSHPAVGILDFRDLVSGGFPPPPGSFMAQMRFERWLAERVTEVLRASGAVRSARGRLMVTVVALLSEESSRRYAVSILPYVWNAFRRIALPAGLEPAVVGVSVLPERWSSLEAAGLFAWLKEFSGALRLGAESSKPWYSLATVIARARATDREEHEARTDPEVELGRAAAEFAAACHTSGMMDWVQAAERGRKRNEHFHSYGITALDADDLRVQVELSRVLWPVLRDLRPRSGRAVARALVGTAPAAEPYLEGWDRVQAAPAGEPQRAWLLRVAGGLEVADLIGADEWRFRYDRLPPAVRGSLHGIAQAVGWPDPLAQSPAAHEPELDPLALAVLAPEPASPEAAQHRQSEPVGGLGPITEDAATPDAEPIKT